MELEDLATALSAHELNSKRRFEVLCDEIKQVAPAVTETTYPQPEESTIMEAPIVKNIFESNPMASMLPLVMGNNSGTGAAIGGGLGAGLLGGVLGGALLGGNGVLGGRGVAGDVGGIVTPALLAASLATNQNADAHTSIMSQLGQIQAAIPLAESQVQLALAGSTASIQATLNTNNTADALASSLTNANIANGTATTLAGQAALTRQLGEAIATSLASQGAIKETVLQVGAANLTATANAQFALSNTVRDDGDKTRALLIAQNEANLNRLLTVSDLSGLENRTVARSREVEVNVTQQVTQNQAQLQAQQQQQQQFQVLANLNAAVCNLANDIQVVRQVQSNVNFGVQGTAGQTATAANTRVN